jgi:hypothetical protein
MASKIAAVNQRALIASPAANRRGFYVLGAVVEMRGVQQCAGLVRSDELRRAICSKHRSPERSGRNELDSDRRFETVRESADPGVPH